MYRNPGNLFAQRRGERRGERSGETRKINTRGGVYRCSNLTCSRGKKKGTMPRNDKGWKPGLCKLARYLLSARYKSVGKPSLTKSTLRNQNWGGRWPRVAEEGLRWLPVWNVPMGGSREKGEPALYTDVPGRSPNRTIC